MMHAPAAHRMSSCNHNESDFRIRNRMEAISVDFHFHLTMKAAFFALADADAMRAIKSELSKQFSSCIFIIIIESARPGGRWSEQRLICAPRWLALSKATRSITCTAIGES